jgi:acetylornithine deacetylase/succinyl-diaminopimelate desuccinylase-like protein
VRTASTIFCLLALLLIPGSIESRESGTEDEVAWLQQYLRIDSSTSDGIERAATFLRDLLHSEGLTTRWIVSPHGQPSVYARLSADPTADGDGTGALLLLHHMDVVAPGPDWSRDPFAGELHDGAVWGRGAVDDKSLGIAHLAALLDLRRSQQPLGRDVIFLAVPEEETGGERGTAWLLEAHPELFEDVTAVLGEGGANRVRGGRLAWWGIEVAQKRPLWLKATATGRGGHGSTVNLHTAPHRLIRGLNRLLDRPLELRVSPEVRRYFEAVAPFESQRFREIVTRLDEILARPQPQRGLLPGLPTYLLDSVQVNVLDAGRQTNMVPDTASAFIDIRLLPDTDGAAFLAEVRRRMGKNVRVEVLLQSPPATESPPEHELFRCLEGVLAPEAPVIPAFIPGITDSRHFRQRGVPAFGFSPFVLDSIDMQGIHGPDEQIPVAAFEQGVALMRQVLDACAAN